MKPVWMTLSLSFFPPQSYNEISSHSIGLLIPIFSWWRSSIDCGTQKTVVLWRGAPNPLTRQAPIKTPTTQTQVTKHPTRRRPLSIVLRWEVSPPLRPPRGPSRQSRKMCLSRPFSPILIQKLICESRCVKITSLYCNIWQTYLWCRWRGRAVKVVVLMRSLPLLETS